MIAPAAWDDGGHGITPVVICSTPTVSTGKDSTIVSVPADLVPCGDTQFSPLADANLMNRERAQEWETSARLPISMHSSADNTEDN